MENIYTDTEPTIEEMREKYTSIRIRCSHLDENLRPFPELCHEEKCPAGKDKKCGNCENFIGFYSETEEVFSYMQFEGFCEYKNK